MTLLDIVERERKGVARRLRVASAAWVVSGVLLVLLIATRALGHARWLALPRIAPFVVWALVVAGA